MGISIFVTDDHALIRQGIKQILSFEKDFSLVGDAADGKTTIEKLTTEGISPDILLMDMNLPDMKGIELVKQLTACHCKAKIIALTVNDGTYYAIEMFKLGARGYVLKGSEADQLVKAIRTVASGGTYIDDDMIMEMPEFAEGKLDMVRKARIFCVENKKKRLTTREVEVLRCIAEGMSNIEMSKKLFVSDKTIKNHLTSIYRKLDVEDRTQALIYALKIGIIGEADGYFQENGFCGA